MKKLLIMLCAAALCLGACHAAETIPGQFVPDSRENQQDAPKEAFSQVDADAEDWNDWGVRLCAENATSTGLTLVCTQSGGEIIGELQTGSPFSLEVYENGQWKPVEELPSEYERAWTMEAWMIPLEDSVQWEVNWEFLYGELDAGLYRITKSIMNWRAPGDFDEQNYTANFWIYDDSAFSNPVTAKPVIYLYPEEMMKVSVSLDYNGQLTCTYPLYDNGWTVSAQPDGTLIDKNVRSYYCLYWEGITDVEYDFSEGFVVKGEDTAAFLEKALAQLGLNEREANEFIIYWLPLMEESPYNLIAFQNECYTDNAVLDIDPVPDSLIRVFMAWKPMDELIELPTQSLNSPVREGFTVVEWGGTKIQ